MDTETAESVQEHLGDDVQVCNTIKSGFCTKNSSDPCVFCGSVVHLSENCVSSVSKMRKVAKAKDLCFLCLSSNFNVFHECECNSLCVNQCCKLKPPHSSVLCKLPAPPTLTCVLISSGFDVVNSFNRLSTMLLWFEDPVSRRLVVLRCMLDTGASHSYILSRSARFLNLTCLGKVRASISSFGKVEVKDCRVVLSSIFGKSSSSETSKRLTFLEVDRLCHPETSKELSTLQRDVISEKGVVLADPEAAISGSLPIDVVIGQDFYYSLVDGGNLVLPDGLRLVHTVYDTFMLAGGVGYSCQKSLESSCNPIASTTTTLNSDEEHVSLDDFTRLDILGISSEEEVHPVLEYYNKTTKVKDGRVEVCLPKKGPQIKKLCPLFSMSFSRTLAGYRRMKRKEDPSEFDKYSGVMKEYLEKGILEKVKCLGSVQEVQQSLARDPAVYDRVCVTNEDTPVHYLPHHPVYKASTGKLRVVYDGKARPYKGAYSLNDSLETGPNLMNSIMYVMMRFRKGKFAAKADIEKAYLMVSICQEDRDLLRIIWIVDGQVWVYRFTRLPFGLSCASFLLAATMLKALDDLSMEKELRDCILSSFYVDDSMFSERSLQALLERKKICVESFDGVGMVLREWTSNDPEARALFSEEEGRELPEVETALGLRWNVVADTISINDQRLLPLIGKKPATKRGLWRFINKLYDPLGLICPYTIQAKHLSREVCKKVKGWDSHLPTALAEKVSRWTEDFVHLKDIVLPRCIEVDQPVWRKLVGFCDASSTGIAALVYLVSSDGSRTISHLVKGNTHIPKEHLKSNIPRLELIGAVMLSNLMVSVRKAYPEISAVDIHYFTDSADVLFWICSGASHSDVFTSNRISDIRKVTDPEHWKHVTSAKNPADVPSRGCSLVKLKSMPLYWNGPDFIREGMVDEDSTVSGYNKAYVQEKPYTELTTRVNIASNTSMPVDSTCNTGSVIDVPNCTISSVIDVSRFGTYNKLIKTSSFVLKFINKLDCLRSARLSKPILCKNINKKSQSSACFRRRAELMWVQSTQQAHFPQLFLLAKNQKAKVDPSSKSLFFEHNVALDQAMGILCCTTRMRDSCLPIESVYPMLLPHRSVFTDLLVRHMHERVGHMGVPQTLSHLRSEFWVLQGRRAVQKVLRRCNPCRRVEGKCFPLPPHPPLPDFRTQRARAFSSVGLDFMGPLKILEDGELLKVYVLLLTCASTRAVHLEAVKSLAINDFMLAMDRFFAAKGVPDHIESDNAGTFVRTNRELKSLFKNKQVEEYFEQKRINWNFYTSRSPHMGGFIEKLNDIFKRICAKTFGKAKLNFEQFRTMIAYAGAVMNDRPLTYVYSNNNSEGQSLSPSMLTLGYSLLEPPHLRMSHKKDAIAKKYGEQFVLLEQVKNLFWEKWSSEYLSELFEKHVKAKRPRPGFPVPKIGDVCLLKNENLPRRKWGLCRVLGFKTPKRDGYIRECRVQRLTKGGKIKILKRSPQFLVPLEIEPHYIDDDPLVKAFTGQEPGSAPADSEQSVVLSKMSNASPEEGGSELPESHVSSSSVPSDGLSVDSGNLSGSHVSSGPVQSPAISDVFGADPEEGLPLGLSSSVSKVVDTAPGLRRSKRVLDKVGGKISGFEVSDVRCPISGGFLGKTVKLVAQPRRSKRLLSGALSKSSGGSLGKVLRSKRLGIKGVSAKPKVLSKLAVPGTTGITKRHKKAGCSAGTNLVSVSSRCLRPRSKTLGLVINPNL